MNSRRNMLDSRRNVIRGLAGAVSLASFAAWQQALAQKPQPMASPNAPSNQNVPAGLNGSEVIRPDKQPVSAVNQEQIAALVHQLFKLATELQEEVEHTNLNTTFSLDFLKKAEQAEKAAKQIKNRAKG